MATFDPQQDMHIDVCENTRRHSTSHFHNVYELCLFTAGTRTYAVDGVCITVRPMSVILVPPYRHHSTRGSVGASRTVVYFSEELLARYFSAAARTRLLACFKNPAVDLTDAGRGNLLGNFELLRRAYEEGDEAAFALHLGELLLLLDLPAAQTEEESPPDRKAELLSAALAYIGEHIGTVGSVGEVADAIYISPSYLALIFKRHMGVSVMQYVIALRVNLAARELAEGGATVSEIAAHCGFSSPTHFSNTFRHHIGLSPTAYRAAFKK